MAIEKFTFLDQPGIQIISESLFDKVNIKVAERIVQEVNDASDHDHVPSALLLNALLKVRDQQISDNKTTIDANTESIANINGDLDGIKTDVSVNADTIAKVTKDIEGMNTKVDALTHLETDMVIGSILDVLNPSTEILYLQKDDESATIWSLWIYREDSTWIRIGDTSIDLSGYWKKTDTDVIKESMDVPDVDPLVEAKIKAAVETAFTNTDPLTPPLPPGPPTDFTITSKNREMVGYTGVEGEELVIPETFIGSDRISYKVVAVDDGAFAGCGNLVSVSIPNSVTSIGIRSFMSCSSLRSITMPEGLTSIGDSAFYLCGSLESVIVPSTVNIIDRGAFVGCTSLSTVILPNGITSISNEVFVRCEALTNIVIPDTVTSIGVSAFASTGLISIDIPNSVNSIGTQALGGCKSLTEINVDHIEDAITGAPWGATNATINWLRTEPIVPVTGFKLVEKSTNNELSVIQSNVDESTAKELSVVLLPENATSPNSVSIKFTISSNNGFNINLGSDSITDITSVQKIWTSGERFSTDQKFILMAVMTVDENIIEYQKEISYQSVYKVSFKNAHYELWETSGCVYPNFKWAAANEAFMLLAGSHPDGYTFTSWKGYNPDTGEVLQTYTSTMVQANKVPASDIVYEALWNYPVTGIKITNGDVIYAKPGDVIDLKFITLPEGSKVTQLIQYSADKPGLTFDPYGKSVTVATGVKNGAEFTVTGSYKVGTETFLDTIKLVVAAKYTLNVLGAGDDSSGSGEYSEGQPVEIYAGTSSTGRSFLRWSAQGANSSTIISAIADVTNPRTTITIPHGTNITPINVYATWEQ